MDEAEQHWLKCNIYIYKKADCLSLHHVCMSVYVCVTVKVWVDQKCVRSRR